MKKFLPLFVLALAGLACTVEFVTPTITPPSGLIGPVGGSPTPADPLAAPVPTVPTVEPAKLLIATMGPDVLAGVRGVVVAAEAVEVRRNPEGSGLDSRNVGNLYPGDTVEQLDCWRDGPNVWVEHAGGWSIVRSANSLFITEVCQ